jgi:YD repeat-containing protein
MAFKKQWALEASDHVLSLAWSGELLVVTPATGILLLANRDGEALAELADHGLSNGTTAVQPGVVATCGFNGRIQVYEVASAGVTPTHEITLGKGWIERTKWSPDGHSLAAALGKTLFILNAWGEIVRTFSDHRTSVSDFAWNPQNPHEITSVCGGGAQMWRVGEAEPFARFDWGGASLLVAWSPDARWIATGDQTPSVHLYDFTRDHPLHIHGFETKVKAMDFSPDGKRLVTGGGSTVTVWNCAGRTGPENTVPDQLSFHKGEVATLAWSPTGEFLASGDNAGRLVISEANGRPVSAFEDKEAITALAWNAEGKRLAAGDAAGRVVLFSD